MRLIGVKLLEFEEIFCWLESLWNEVTENQKRNAGRECCLKTLEDKVIALLMYYRTYITHEFIGYLFGLHNSNVCRLFKRLEPLMARKLTIKKDRTLTEEEVLKLLVDVTEQPIQRSKQTKRHNRTYSAKKKRHTTKVELVMTAVGKIR